MRNIIKKYLIEGDAITAWLILKAPLLMAFIYSFQAVKMDQQGIITTVFFFPYVFFIFKNLWLEVLHEELLSKLKFESGLEIEVNRKLFRITRFMIAALAIAEMYLIPAVMNSPSRPSLSDIPIMVFVSIALILTFSLFIFQFRFARHVGNLLHVLETKRKLEPIMKYSNAHRLRMSNPIVFRKYHDRIKSILKKV